MLVWRLACLAWQSCRSAALTHTRLFPSAALAGCAPASSLMQPPMACTNCAVAAVQIAVSLATHVEALPAGLVHSVKVSRAQSLLSLQRSSWAGKTCSC